MVPETPEEFDSLGGPGTCLREATNNVVYRKWNHDFRGALCERLVEETGVARATIIKKDDEGKEVEVLDPSETEKKYYNSLIAAGKLTEEQAQIIANEVAESIAFDPTPSKRSKKVPKEITVAATNILAAVDAGQVDEEKVIANFSAALDITPEDFTARFGEFGEEAVIAALIADADKQERERASRFL